MTTSLVLMMTSPNIYSMEMLVEMLI